MKNFQFYLQLLFSSSFAILVFGISFGQSNALMEVEGSQHADLDIFSDGNGVAELKLLEKFSTNWGMVLRYNGDTSSTGLGNVFEIRPLTEGVLREPSFSIERDSGTVRVGRGGLGNKLLVLNSDRSWAFEQQDSGAVTALKLTAADPNNNNKNFIIDTDGFVGIRDNVPTHQISLGANLAHIKLALYEKNDNTETYGMGITEDRFRFHLGNNEARFAFYDDDASTASEIFAIHGNGNIFVKGTLVHSSDRNRKEDISSIHEKSLLLQLKNLPIYEWQYKGQSRRHIGPMAQDFHQTFGLGDDPTTIASIDADGIALAAIQALAAEVASLREDLEDLRARKKN